MSTPIPPSLDLGMRRHIRVGLLLLALLLLGIGGWTALTRLSGAVIASGRVVVEGSQKAVQHVEGGLVKQLTVTEGMTVNAGDLLMTLDATSLQAKLAVTERQALELIANNLRLSVERDGKKSLDPSDSPELTAGLAIPPQILAAQENLFMARQKSAEGQVNQLHERIAQNEEMINGLKTQKRAKVEEFRILKDRLNRLNKLTRKKLVAEDQLMTVRSELAVVRGDVGKFTAEIARTKGMISELQYQIHQLREQRLSKIISELNENKARLSGLWENRTELLDNLSKLEIRAPSSGRVHQLVLHTVGGVLGAGDIAMYIVPENERLIVEVQLSPVDIDQVKVGQKGRLRFSAFDQDEVPELTGSVQTIAADIVEDKQTGDNSYSVRILIEPKEIGKLDGRKLQPGMPVDAFIETRSRTVLAYLVEPLTNHFSRAFRE